MEGMPPKVSVVMAVHNGLPFVRDAVKSILAQDLKDLEFIIVDDASTDGTGDEVAGLADPRIIYLRQDINIGQTAALNIGIRASRSAYIARMDADDISLPGRLSAQAAFLDTHEQVGVVGTWQETMDENGRVSGVRRFPTDPWEVRAGLFTSSPLNWFVISHPTVMIRRSALEKAGLYDESFRICQDFDLWQRIGRACLLTNIPQVGLRYRYHQASLSQKDLAKTKDEVSRALLKNIRVVLNGLGQKKEEELLSFLLYEIPAGKTREIVEIFHQYFREYMLHSFGCEDEERIRRRAERIVAYSLPQLVKVDAIFALGVFFGILCHDPKALFSKRFCACAWYAMRRKW